MARRALDRLLELARLGPAGSKECIEKMNQNISYDKLFGFRNSKECSQMLVTNSANLHIVFHFLRTFAKFRQNFIKIEHLKGKYVENVLIHNKFIFEITKKLDAFC